MIPPAWAEALAPAAADGRGGRGAGRRRPRRRPAVAPAEADVWRALALTPPEAVRVVLLGQDPYPTPGHADGLAFSVRPGVAPLPRSLANVLRELDDDLGLPAAAERQPRSLGAAGRAPAQHRADRRGRRGERPRPLGLDAGDRRDHRRGERPARAPVFLLWGRRARPAARIAPRHTVLAAAHPARRWPREAPSFGRSVTAPRPAATRMALAAGRTAWPLGSESNSAHRASRRAGWTPACAADRSMASGGRRGRVSGKRDPLPLGAAAEAAATDTAMALPATRAPLDSAADRACP